VKKKILVVDDDPTSLRTVEGLLTLHGYEVKTSTQAQTIEELVKDFNPQLIVMDLMMPEVDGSQAVSRLQNNAALKNIPVIFLTALNLRDDEHGLEAEIAVQNKSFRTLTKPLNPKALVAAIRELTGQ
jgi:CheY-like chemotaxis protein